MIDGAIRARTLDGRYADIAREHRQRPAIVVHEGRSWSHGELDRVVSRIARAIVERLGDDARGERVALLLAAPDLQVAAIHAVLRAGHAFVPLDASHPRARLAALVAHADARLVLSDDALSGLAREVAGATAVVCVDDLAGAASDASGADVEPRTPDAEAMACILYTSGSTGAPKGVVHSHASLLHSFMNYANSLELGPTDRLALCGSTAFAATLSDVFGATLSGAALCAYPLARLGLGPLPGFIADQRVTVWFMVPSVFRRVVLAMTGAEDLSALRVLKLAGEAVRRDDFELFERRFPRGARFLNSLGLTEMNLVSQRFLRHGDAVATARIPVGRVAPDVAVRIADPDPDGVGVITVVSRWLARGYWRAPELDAAAFAELPDGRRAFRSGDLGRLRDGVLEHLGRADAQVKVAGVRVDPGEVEAALVATGLAREAIVMARGEAGAERLVAWLVPELPERGAGALAEVRRRLGERLPTAMLPRAVVGLAAWPLGPNGKVDRQALPDPVLPATTAARPEPPRDALEELVVQALRRTLGRRVLGVDDDFFAVGGDSLAAMSATLRLEQELGRAVPAAALLVGRTPRAVAAALRDGAGEPHWRTLVPLQVRGDEPPLFCVHPRPGNVACYVALAGHLAPDMPVYGLQARGLDGRAAPAPSLSHMVDDYLAEVRRVAPCGPYRLIGWCVGGLVALEMARRLVDDGAEVELVALCDSRIPMRGARAWRAELGRARSMGVGAFLAHELARARTELRGTWRAARGRARVEAGETLVVAHMDRLQRSFRPARYVGRVLALETTAPPPPARVRAPEWLDAAAIEVVSLDCAHDRVLAEPMVRTVAGILRARLARRPA
ncbi:MAG: AMP-binding protein [Myxococcota bacterium]